MKGRRLMNLIKKNKITSIDIMMKKSTTTDPTYEQRQKGIIKNEQAHDKNFDH